MPIQSFNTSPSTSARPELGTFRPGLAWRLTNIVPIIALLALVPFVLLGGPSKESIPFAIVVLAFGPWIAVRSWISRVSYSRSEVHVVGLLWSRRIQLDDIVSVETRASAPSILWQKKIWSPLPQSTHCLGKRIHDLAVEGISLQGVVP